MDGTALSSPLLTPSDTTRHAARRDWLERARRDLAAARAMAEAPGNPNAAEAVRHLQAMLDAASDADCLSTADRAVLATQSRAIACIAYLRLFEMLLDKGHAVVRGECRGQLEPVLEQAGLLMRKLERLQLDATVFHSLRAKLAILEQTSRRGDSAKAKPREDLTPRRFANDQRLFVRYRDPALVVQLLGSRYRTINWSLGGLLLGGVPHVPAAAGALVDIKFCLEAGRMHEDRAVIIRHDSPSGTLALRLRRFGSTLVSLKQECDVRGIVPRA